MRAPLEVALSLFRDGRAEGVLVPRVRQAGRLGQRVDDLLGGLREEQQLAVMQPRQKGQPARSAQCNVERGQGTIGL